MVFFGGVEGEGDILVKLVAEFNTKLVILSVPIMFTLSLLNS